MLNKEVMKENINLKIEELLRNFDNGNERYFKNAVFNTTVRSLAYGADELQIIGKLLKIIETQQDSMIEYINNGANVKHFYKLEKTINQIKVK